MIFDKLKKLLFGSVVLVVTLSSLTYLVKQRASFKEKINLLLQGKKDINYDYGSNEEKNKLWSKKILSGGYVLFFRHAERDKWIDVQMYDALESELQEKNSNSFRFAENEYFEGAVCLNKRGKIQARAMGEVIKYSKLPIGYIASSPSCRARQTANLVFGGYDELEKTLVHKGPYKEVGDRSGFLEKYIVNLPKSNGKNTIISAHNGVIGHHLFPEKEQGKRKYLEEGGFYVLSINNKNELILEHEFHNFLDFSRQFYIRNHD